MFESFTIGSVKPSFEKCFNLIIRFFNSSFRRDRLDTLVYGTRAKKCYNYEPVSSTSRNAFGIILIAHFSRLLLPLKKSLSWTVPQLRNSIFSSVFFFRWDRLNTSAYGSSLTIMNQSFLTFEHACRFFHWLFSIDYHLLYQTTFSKILQLLNSIIQSGF